MKGSASRYHFWQALQPDLPNLNCNIRLIEYSAVKVGSKNVLLNVLGHCFYHYSVVIFILVLHKNNKHEITSQDFETCNLEFIRCEL